MTTPSRLISSLTLAASLSLCASVSFAQTPPPAGADAGAAPAPSYRIENGHRVYVQETAIDVRGEIQRPYAFSVSGRSSLGYTYFEQSISFVREILDALRRSPF